MSANRLSRRLTVLAGVDRMWVWFPTAQLTVEEACVSDG